MHGVAGAQGAHRLLLKTTNIKMGVRLGLLKQDHSRALVFEVDSARCKGGVVAAALLLVVVCSLHEAP
jgi:hypothetical protein